MSPQLSIIADDKIPFLKGVFEPYANIRYLAGENTTAEDVKDADILITRTRTLCNATLLADSRVSFIATATIGYDHLDREYLKQRSISWINAPGCNSSSVMQYVTAACLEFMVKNGLRPEEMTMGIIGVGHVGSKVATMASTLGMRVLLLDPPRMRQEGAHGFVPLQTLKNESDIITLHVPLIQNGEDATEQLIDEKFLHTLRRCPLIINTSRGEVIDESALLHAFTARKIRGTILDVWEHEPDVDPELIDLCAIATPHIAGYSTDGKAMATQMVVRAISHHFNLPLHDFAPTGVKPPLNPIISIPRALTSPLEVIAKAVSHSYDIKEDDNLFRRDPSRFEEYRRDYPLRREFQHYTVDAPWVDNTTRIALQKLGFSLKKEMS